MRLDFHVCGVYLNVQQWLNTVDKFCPFYNYLLLIEFIFMIAQYFSLTGSSHYYYYYDL